MFCLPVFIDSQYQSSQFSLSGKNFIDPLGEESRMLLFMEQRIILKFPRLTQFKDPVIPISFNHEGDVCCASL